MAVSCSSAIVEVLLVAARAKIFSILLTTQCTTSRRIV